MLVRALFVITAASLAMLVLAPHARAQDGADASRDAEGRGLFEAGRAAFADGRYEDALQYYERAYELTHRAELLYNIGSAYDRLRRDREALAAFSEYRLMQPDAANAREVDARMRVLREAIAHDEAAAPSSTELPMEPAPTAEHVVELAPTTTAPAAPPERRDDGPGIVGEWWLWTIVGLVAAGGIALGVVLGTQGSTTTYPPYQTGDNGAVVMALTGALP